MNKIITISREFGSGGRELGRYIADTLKTAYYDQEIISELSKRTNLTENYIRQVEENKFIPLLPITTGITFSSQFYQAMEPDQTAFLEQSKMIREMADKTDCVIVGRCADYILQERSPLRLFVYADTDFKLARCREKEQSMEGETDAEMRRKINVIDRQRARYYQFHTGRTWGDTSNYDLCINTTSLDIKSVTAAIVRLFD